MKVFPHLGAKGVGFFFLSLLVPQITSSQGNIALSTVLEQTSTSSMFREFEISGGFWKYLLKTERLDSNGDLKLTILDESQTAVLQINSQKDDIQNLNGVFFTKGKHVAFVEAKGYQWHLTVLQSPKQKDKSLNTDSNERHAKSGGEYITFGALFVIVGGTLVILGGPHEEHANVGGTVITVTKTDEHMQTVGYILGGAGILMIALDALDE